MNHVGKMNVLWLAGGMSHSRRRRTMLQRVSSTVCLCYWIELCSPHQSYLHLSTCYGH